MHIIPPPTDHMCDAACAMSADKFGHLQQAHLPQFRHHNLPTTSMCSSLPRVLPACQPPARPHTQCAHCQQNADGPLHKPKGCPEQCRSIHNKRKQRRTHALSNMQPPQQGNPAHMHPQRHRLTSFSQHRHLLWRLLRTPLALSTINLKTSSDL
jgi:hypothetical protein